jgi:hypothetical protein
VSKLRIQSLDKLTKTLNALPKVLGEEIARRAAPIISRFAKESFDRSSNAYEVPWSPADSGELVTLRKSGKLEKFLVYVAIGTKLRVALGVAYAKYQIGKRPVFPTQGGILPKKYSTALQTLTREAAKEYLDAS